jgi:polynucleotide 5'-kinase involved in rRNA processing
MMDWATKAQLNRGQQRAFEIMVGTFVLSFYNQELDEDETGHGFRSPGCQFIKEKRKLELLVDRMKQISDQLLLLLHGPVGSGKTTAFDLLMEYAREYCS